MIMQRRDRALGQAIPVETRDDAASGFGAHFFGGDLLEQSAADRFRRGDDAAARPAISKVARDDECHPLAEPAGRIDQKGRLAWVMKRRHD